MYAAFIDMEKAYDKVWRADLWVTLRGYGVRGKLLGSISTVQRKQGMRKSGGGGDKRVYGRTGSTTGVPLIPVVV